jgi:hypothetical protein
MHLGELMFWQSAPKVEITLHGARDLKFDATIPLPAASAGQTVKYILVTHPIVGASAGTAGVAATACLIFLGLRRRKKKADIQAILGPKALRVLAILEDLEDGRAFPIQTSIVQIGRDEANDVILGDRTVSRVHAVLEQSRDGAFFIENRSSVNGTLINHLPAERSVLHDGDLIGDRTFRFSLPVQSHALSSQRSSPL